MTNKPQTKHTQGPWKVVSSWNDFMVEGPNGEEIIWQDGNYDTPTMKFEDARLIAAAPDMYSAICEVMDNPDLTDEQALLILTKARNKAEGTL